MIKEVRTLGAVIHKASEAWPEHVAMMEEICPELEDVGPGIRIAKTYLT